MFMLGAKRFHLSIMDIYLPVMKLRNLKYGNLGESSIMHGYNDVIFSKQLSIQPMLCHLPNALAFIKYSSL